jgi:phosphate:Na+ symporter
MTGFVFPLVGGIGLFLLGMALLSDGLKAFAGDSLRRVLVRFTGSPVKAFASGALATALVQSSSATTVMVIGFVSAGLLTFPQAIGVVLGASLGTTSTGWIVAAIGLKISVGFYALLLVGIGAFAKLLARGRWKSAGLALAGFGLIFVGIDTLQSGMQGLSGVFKLSELPSAGFLSHLTMMLVGIAMTIVMQSSSAAMATTLTALHTASINFEQAASLVIGAAVGTTLTGALAAIGASVSTQRTALAHVLFNSATGLIAVVFLPVFLWSIRMAQNHLGLEAGAISLAAFHTSFIAAGAAAFLPRVDRFAQWIERRLPEQEPTFTRHLDPTLLNVPTVALEAARRALKEMASEMFAILRDQLAGQGGGWDEARRAQLQRALDDIQEFFAKIPPVAEAQALSAAHLAQMHAIDHMVRLHPRLRPPVDLRQLIHEERLTAELRHTRDILELALAGLQDDAPIDWLADLEKRSVELAERERQDRPEVLLGTTQGSWGPAAALNRLDTMRWLERVSHHTWRICNYLGGNHNSEAAAETHPKQSTETSISINNQGASL